jgi:hypothetical protein
VTEEVPEVVEPVKPSLPTPPVAPSPPEPQADISSPDGQFLTTGNQCQRDIPVSFKNLKEITNFESMGVIIS